MSIIMKYKNRITALSFVLILAGIIFGNADMEAARNAALVTATVLASIPIGMKAFQSLRMKAFSIELLVIIAVVGALYIQEYMESSVVTFLFLFGAYLEARTLEKTRSSLKNLLDMAPQEAMVLRNGEGVVVSVDDITEGDTIMIRSGGKVAVDGTILSGEASINEAAITGESVPVIKGKGDKLFSGSLLDHGYVEMTAEKVGEDTTFSKIIELVEEAQEAKSKAARFLDKFAQIYTPGVVVLSVLVYFITQNLHIAITFLVVACPGALVIGAPVSNVAGIGNGAKNGVLVKGGEVMDRLSKVDTLVFDKTGTLTKGKPEVSGIRTFQEISEEELLRLTATVENASEHHLGQTIVKEAKARNIEVSGDLENLLVEKGRGITAKLHEKVIAIGNRKLMEEHGIEIERAAEKEAVRGEKQGNTVVFTAVDGVISGLFLIRDQIREDAFSSLKELRASGIRQIIMLTGDNRHTAELVARELELDEYHAELLPKDKLDFVEKLKKEGKVVLMAGDGINDAPAIATADIGLAMGDGGTDVALETADLVLLGDNFRQLTHAYSLAKATVRNMKQNIWFAVGVVALLLAGVLSGRIHLAEGMFIHEASVILVILNAMRLVKYRRKNLVAESEKNLENLMDIKVSS
ncbi:heavy metal translocating P-type ATPase [Proteiniclasticum sp. C24MP]|uniref:heavy metal translocating P-type ATPase n=1 Tax=Proteiniclasticum sp. C24MP TaxID=3374101 RepID=UPI0037542584